MTDKKITQLNEAFAVLPTDLVPVVTDPLTTPETKKAQWGNVLSSLGVLTATPSPLTKVNDTNVTLTLGGTPATALLEPVSLTLGWSGQLSIARGGTGQATALAAFNALSPLTTRGDVLTHDATNNVRLGKGAAGTYPTWDANDLIVSKLILTQPATSATLTIADGKTLTVNNTLTLAASADGYTLTIPATGTAALLGVANTFTNTNTFNYTDTSYTNIRPVVISLKDTVNPSSAPGALTDYHLLDNVLSTTGANLNSNVSLYPLESTAYHNTSATINGIFASYFLADLGAGSAAESVGVRVLVRSESAGTLTWGKGVRVDAPTNTGGGAITHFASFYAVNPGASYYSYYSEGGLNFFAGALRLGYNGSTTDGVERLVAGMTSSSTTLTDATSGIYIYNQNGTVNNFSAIAFHSAATSSALDNPLAKIAAQATASGSKFHFLVSNNYSSPASITALLLNYTGNALVGTATDGMTTGGSLAIAQDLAHRGTKVGFYNIAPITQPTNTTDLRAALINLGLYANGGATPLDLNGGAITAGKITINGGQYVLSGSPGGLGASTRYMSGAGTAGSWYINAVTANAIYLAIGESSKLTVNPTNVTIPIGNRLYFGSNSYVYQDAVGAFIFQAADGNNNGVFGAVGSFYFFGDTGAVGTGAVKFGIGAPADANAKMTLTNGGDLIVGTSSTALAHLDVVGAVDKQQLRVLGYTTQSIGTPLVGFTRNDTAAGVSQILGLTAKGSAAIGDGGSILMSGLSSTTTEPMAMFAWLFNSPTDASYKADLVAYAYDKASAREIWRGRGSGSVAMLGLFGVAPVVQPTGDLFAGLVNLGANASPVIPNGSMYLDDGSIAVTVSATNTEYAVGAGLSAGSTISFTFSNSTLTCNVAGTYQCHWSMAFSSSNNNEMIEGGIIVNTTAVVGSGMNAENINGGKDVAVSGHVILTLAANDVVKLYVENDTAVHNITVTHATVTLTRIS